MEGVEEGKEGGSVEVREREGARKGGRGGEGSQ